MRDDIILLDDVIAREDAHALNAEYGAKNTLEV
jgi:hypothetical protein